jgi:hypothetical protein
MSFSLLSRTNEVKGVRTSPASSTRSALAGRREPNVLINLPLYHTVKELAII